VRPRFHLSQIASSELDEDESGHLTRVLRLGVGAEIDVFDGRGGMFHARVTAVNRARVRVQVLAPVAAAAEPVVRVTLVMSVLKGDKMDDVVRDAAMMGVAAVQPVVAARSEIRLAALGRGRRIERWQRVAIAGVKQCGRAVVPAVHPPQAVADWLVQIGPDPILVLTEPSAGAGTRLAEVPPTSDVHLVVGPEGGWTGDELKALMAAGARSIGCGPRTLRADAAPIVALAALYESWNAW
jgi:16S rRNA (uracil1498-N3)-methyltransferase